MSFDPRPCAPRRTTPVTRIRVAALLVALLVAAPGCTTLKRLAYEDFGGRDEWQQPDRVVAALGLRPGDRVADLGAGGGYFAFRLAEAVGPSGRAWAVDVDEGMNEHVAREAEARGLEQLSVVLAAPDDPRLPEPVDLVFTSNTYHHLDDRVAYFERIRTQYLRPGGRVAVVDYRPEATSHSTPRATIVEELEAAGFSLVEEHDWLDRQCFLVFSPESEVSE